MRRIRKIFNNNIVNAVDPSGEDVILVGAGVGFATKQGNTVDESRVEREFHVTGLARGGSFRVLLEIPYPVLRATYRVTAMLRTVYGFDLPAAAEVGLADHVAQAIRRIEEGGSLYNSMLWETKMTYATEFAVALHALDVFYTELGIKLPLDEAGFITLHLVNAGLVGDPGRAMALSSALRAVIEIVESDLGVVIDGSTGSSARFLTHIKFVVQRLTRNSAHNGALGEYFEALTRDHPAEYACAQRIGTYLNQAFDTATTSEEHLYILIHLLKLSSEPNE